MIRGCHRNTHCAQNVQFLNVKSGGIISSYWAGRVKLERDVNTQDVIAVPQFPGCFGIR